MILNWIKCSKPKLLRAFSGFAILFFVFSTIHHCLLAQHDHNVSVQTMTQTLEQITVPNLAIANSLSEVTMQNAYGLITGKNNNPCNSNSQNCLFKCAIDLAINPVTKSQPKGVLARWDSIETLLKPTIPNLLIRPPALAISTG